MKCVIFLERNTVVLIRCSLEGVSSWGSLAVLSIGI